MHPGPHEGPHEDGAATQVGSAVLSRTMMMVPDDMYKGGRNLCGTILLTTQNFLYQYKIFLRTIGILSLTSLPCYSTVFFSKPNS